MSALGKSANGSAVLSCRGLPFFRFWELYPMENILFPGLVSRDPVRALCEQIQTKEEDENSNASFDIVPLRHYPGSKCFQPTGHLRTASDQLAAVEWNRKLGNYKLNRIHRRAGGFRCPIIKPQI